jgi:fibronectin type 3 domain-containing protein
MKRWTTALSFAVTLAVAPAAAASVLPAPFVQQEQSQWCWVGVSDCVLGYYGTTLDQCTIAEWTREQATWHDFGPSDCCVDPTQGCNYWNYNWGYAGSIQDILQHWGVDNYGIGPLSLDEIGTQIAAGHPFIIRWGWTTGGGHFVTGHGVEGSMVSYMDPWPGEGFKTGTYDWVVYGGGASGTHTWTHTNVITTDVAISPPTGVAASDGTYADRVQVSWNASSGATSYQVWRNTADSSGGSTQLSGTPSASPYDDTTATPGTTYYYFLKACNGAACSGFSTSDSGYRGMSAPTGVTASDGTYTDKVQVSWNASTGASSYEVYQNTVSLPGGSTLLGSPSASPYDDTGATPGQSYYYFVKACNGGHCSDYSASDPGFRGMPVPTGVTASDGTFTDKVQVSWNASSGATMYQVYRNTTDSSVEATALDVPTDTTSFDDTTATPATTYWYFVMACNGVMHAIGVCSDYSASDSGYRAGPPPAVVVTASDGTYTDEVRVTWTAPADATSYELYRNTSSSSSGAQQLGGGPLVATAYDDTTATPGMLYYYFAKACNGGGCSDLSTPDSGYRAMHPPTGVTASDGTFTDKVQVSWTASTGATSYQVYRNTSDSSSGATQLGTPAASPYDDTSATPGATYYYFVKGCASAGCTDFSASDSGYRLAAPPNDECDGATTLATEPFLSSIDTTNATTAGNDPALSGCGRPAGTKSVWYSYTPSTSRWLYLDTFGSNYDTMIGVFTGACGSLTPVTCNDDDARSPGGLNSAVALDATAGTTYYIVVYGFAGSKSPLLSSLQDSDPQAAAATSTTLQFHATTFYDVPGSHSFWRYIEGFYVQGITTGCAATPFSYCPDNPVTRAAMAVFLLRAMHGGSYVPPASTGVFADVPTPGKEWMQPWIEEFYQEGITTGCGADPLRYCPESSVTRAAMAVFVLRSIKGTSYQPPASTGIFADVPVAGKEWMQPWVEEFYREGITTGCATDPLRYCPENPVTRGAMGVFISRAFSLPQLP